MASSPASRNGKLNTTSKSKTKNSKINVKDSKGWFLPRLLNIFNKKDDNQILEQKKIPTIGLREKEELIKLKVSRGDRKKLLDLFIEMAGKGQMSCSFKAFSFYFRFYPDIWIRRIFELINEQYTGSFSFLEFLVFLRKYLIIDRDMTEEFSFRFLSRRGMNFIRKYSVLDLDDIAAFVALRYAEEFRKLPAQRKMALEIFSFIDSDGDGGITFEEFQEFCKDNSVFVKVSHRIQNHLRKCIFGFEFWVDISRKYKTAASSTLDVITAIHGINHDSELYTVVQIQDPVVDNHGNPIRIISIEARNVDDDSEDEDELDEQETFVASITSRFAQNPDNNESLDQKSNVGNQMISDPGHLNSNVSMSSISLLGDDSTLISGPSMLEKAGSIASIGSINSSPSKIQMQPINLFPKEDTRKKVLFREPFSMKENIPLSTFARDFPEIMKRRQDKRKQKYQQEEDRRKRISSLSAHNYDRLVIAISDLIYQRKDLRCAFKRWLQNTNMKSKIDVQIHNRNKLKRLGTENAFSLEVTTTASKDMDYLTVDGSVDTGLDESQISRLNPETSSNKVLDDISLSSYTEESAGNIHSRILQTMKNQIRDNQEKATQEYFQSYLQNQFLKNFKQSTSIESLAQWKAHSLENLDRLNESKSFVNKYRF